jgi:hypothetical protein
MAVCILDQIDWERQSGLLLHPRFLGRLRADPNRSEIGEFESPFLFDPPEYSKEFGNKFHPNLVAENEECFLARRNPGNAQGYPAGTLPI